MAFYTSRLIIREIKYDDARAYYEYASDEDVALVRQTVLEAIDRARQSDRTLKNRLGSVNRQASLTVREKMRAIW